MDFNMIISFVVGALVGLFTSRLGGVILTYGYGRVGEKVEETETPIDDVAYESVPKFLDFLTENFELGTADKVIEMFLEVLEETDADTKKLEEYIKKEEFGLLKNYLEQAGEETKEESEEQEEPD